MDFPCLLGIDSEYQDGSFILNRCVLNVNRRGSGYLCYNGRDMVKRLLLISLFPFLLMPADSGKKKKNLLLDAAMVSAVTCAYVLIIPDTRQRIFREASIRKVWENFKYPVWSAREGGKRDHNGFWINYVGHPLSYMALGLYLKERGYDNLETLAFTQTANVVWEYVIEGSLWLPSSKDLLSDLCGSLAAVYVMAPLSELGERKIAAGDRRWGNYLLYYLNPFKKINRLFFGPRKKSPVLCFSPKRSGVMIGMVWLK